MHMDWKVMAMMNLSAAILVGRSTRMGRDKALLELDHQTFMRRLARELSICDEVFVCATLGRKYHECDLRVIPDEHQGIGPMEGIRQSLRHAAADHVFICACDMPFVRREMILYLSEHTSPDFDACVFRHGDKIHPLCGIYGKTALPVVEKIISEGRYRMMDLLSSLRTNCVEIAEGGFSAKTLDNINTPADYARITQ